MKHLNWLILVLALTVSSCASKENKAAQNLVGDDCQGELSICGYSVIKSTNSHTIKTPPTNGVVYHVDAAIDGYTYVDAYKVTCTSNLVCTEISGIAVVATFESNVRVIQFQESGSVETVTFSVKAVKSGETGPSLNAQMQ